MTDKNSPEEVHRNIFEYGAHIFGEILNQEKCSSLLSDIRSKRSFSRELFLTEDEFLQQDHHFGTNPDKNNNFLNRFSGQLLFIENDSTITNAIKRLLGDDYEIFLKKIVCGVPEAWLPDYVNNAISDNPIANLGAYVKKEFRDITYFRGIDFHQDIIDWPEGRTDYDASSFMTLYVYLHDVGQNDSPLHLMKKTHRLGATSFPHKLTKLPDSVWEYKDDRGKKIECTDLKLTGKTGYVALWHNCTLHGTQPVEDESDNFRISLRYLVSKSRTNNEDTGIDIVNRAIDGNLHPVRTRKDLDTKTGKVILKGNIINKHNGD